MTMDEMDVGECDTNRGRDLIKFDYSLVGFFSLVFLVFYSLLLIINYLNNEITVGVVNKWATQNFRT